MNPPRPGFQQAKHTARIVGWIARCRSYVWIPQTLIDRYRAHPLVLALYVVYARLWMAWPGPDGIPVSDADLKRLFPEISHGSLQAARQHLHAGGWIIQTRCGNKNTYIPTWGFDHTGTIRPWTKEKGWNRQSAKTVRFNRDLLDYYVGRLLPNPAKAATVERYVEIPLRLATIGAVVVGLRSHTITDAAAISDLEAHGIFRNGEWVAPATPREILSQSSRTERGTRRLSQWTLNPDHQSTAESPTAPSPATLFFGMGLINGLLNLLINSCATQFHDDLPLGAAESPSEWEQWYPIGNQGMLNSWNPPAQQKKPTQEEDLENQRWGAQEHQTPSHNDRYDKLIARKPQSRRHAKRKNIMSIEDTPAAAALRAIHVHPKQIHELAHMDLDVVTQVIAVAQSRPSVQDIAGWTVTILRDLRDNPGKQVPRASTDEPSWETIHANAAPWFAERQTGIHPHAAMAVPTSPLPEDDPRRPDWLTPEWWVSAPEADRQLLAYVQRDGDTLHAPDVWRRGALKERPDLVAAVLALPQQPEIPDTDTPITELVEPAPEDDPRRPDWIPIEWWASATSVDRHTLAYVQRGMNTLRACDQWRQRTLRERPDLVAVLMALP